MSKIADIKNIKRITEILQDISNTHINHLFPITNEEDIADFLDATSESAQIHKIVKLEYLTSQAGKESESSRTEASYYSNKLTKFITLKSNIHLDFDNPKKFAKKLIELEQEAEHIEDSIAVTT